LTAPLHLALAAEPEHAEEARERAWELVRAGARVGAVERFAGRPCYLKAAPLAGKAALRHGLRERVLRRPAPRLGERANLLWLRAHGFRAPRPLAAAAFRRGLRTVYQLLWTEWIAGAPTLARVLDGAAAEGREPPGDWVAPLARDVARLHALGFVHRDLYPRNLLVLRGGAEPAVAFLDAWRGGARRQLRGPSYDLACLMLDGASRLPVGLQRELFAAYFAERARRGRAADPRRTLARAARERARLARRSLHAAPPAEWDYRAALPATRAAAGG